LINPPPPRQDRAFRRVVKLSGALGLGALAAFLYSVKAVHPALRFEVGAGTVVAALLGGAAAWAFLGVVFREEDTAGAGRSRKKGRRSRLGRWLWLFAAVMLLGTVLAFARALRGISSENARDVVEGTVAAFVFVGLVGYVLWRVVRFLESQDEHAPPPPPPPDNEPDPT
jgi:Na+/citrate or Na+/malate symporter